jgi:2-oxo-4-hydroxy-4-carboxy-5-ureidoimidazoline decarboxylase
LAVKGSTKYDILNALEKRLQALPDEEYENALRQVFRIARFRLEDAVR